MCPTSAGRRDDDWGAAFDGQEAACHPADITLKIADIPPDRPIQRQIRPDDLDQAALLERLDLLTRLTGVTAEIDAVAAGVGDLETLTNGLCDGVRDRGSGGDRRCWRRRLEDGGHGRW